HQHAELCSVPASAAERQPRPPETRSSRPAADTVIDQRPAAPPPQRMDAESEPTNHVSVFEMLSGVAGKAFELGRGLEAERILRRPLEGLLAQLEAGKHPVDAREADEAGLLAVKLARSTGQSQWIDYVFRLFGGLARLAPSAVIDELYPAVRVATGASLIEYRRYLEILRNGQANLGPADRFLLRRLEGLEGVLAYKSGRGTS
ncbi:MAG TPA: hypothetical protein VG963_13230, partial [Polyangiaceae bacterium]|nr:hypothetical protein [Polyangiaceae bacterium]